MTRNMDAGTGWTRWRGAACAAIPVLLLVPLVAMQVTDEVAWTAFDFIAAGVLLSAALAIVEIALRVTHDTAYRAAVGIAVLAALLLTWVTGAVGIIGTEEDAANLLFAAVLAIVVVGSIAARLRPRAMMRVLVATAIAQAVIGVVAIAGRLGDDDPAWPADVIGLTALFTGLWLIAAVLFRHAARGAEARTAVR